MCHTEISRRVTQNLSVCQVIVIEHNIKNWFSKLKTYQWKKYSWNLQHLNRIFNCEETTFYLFPKDKQVLLRRVSKKVYCCVANDQKEYLTSNNTSNKICKTFIKGGFVIIGYEGEYVPGMVLEKNNESVYVKSLTFKVNPCLLAVEYVMCKKLNTFKKIRVFFNFISFTSFCCFLKCFSF